MTRHTPGPWEAIGNKVCTVAKDRDRVTIATTSERAFGNTPDAILIAAAPELLEGLQNLVEVLEGICGEYPVNETAGKWIDLANQAIHKATGRKG